MSRFFPVIWVLKRIRKRIPALLCLVLSNVGSAVMGVIFALGTRNVIDTATGDERSLFLNACLLQAGIILFSILFSALSRHINERLMANLDRDWKKSILNGLLHGEYSAVSAYHSGELINRLNNDVRVVNDGLVNAIPKLISMVVRLASAMIVLISLEPWFALLISLAGILVIAVTGLLRSRLKNLHKRVSEKDGLVSAFLQETLEKLLMVQAMDVSDEMERRADGLLEDRFNMQRKRKNISVFAHSCVSIMSHGATFAALVWCSVRLLDGAITFGSLTAVMQLVSQLQTPFTGLSAIIPQYIAMMASAERLMELENIPREPKSAGENPEELYSCMDAICGEGLIFSYDRDPVFDNADFRMPKGAFAAVIGPSGIGKSTLLKLLLGIFHPEQGSLYADCSGEKVLLDRRTRKLFAYVPQGNLVMSGTLRDNLLIARPDATEEQVQRAVYISDMESYLGQLPNGLDTVLGENGAGLSEGQTQRLAIARAILSGAPILLLDESTSALDSRTEETVLERIRSMTDCTCIAVTHRPAILALCDWRLAICAGKITAEEIN